MDDGGSSGSRSIGRLAASVLVLAVLAFGVWLLVSAPERPGKPSPWRFDDPVVADVNRGVAWMEQYDYAKAVAAFERVVARAPDAIEARLALAMATFNRNAKGDVAEAEGLLDEILAEQPDQVGALYMRGIVHQYAGRDKVAVTFFERVVAQVPGDAHAWYFLARSKANLGMACEAELKKAIAANPGLVSAYYLAVRMAAQAGKDEEATAYQEKFLALRQSPLAEAVVMPEYHRMGPLAVVHPLSARPGRALRSGVLTVGAARSILEGSTGLGLRAPNTLEVPEHGGGLALGDIDGDGRLDIIAACPRSAGAGLTVLLGIDGPAFRDATENAGLAAPTGCVSCSLGDIDNDDILDLYVCRDGPNFLFRGRGDGTFVDITGSTGTAGATALSRSAVFLDADHDADLDIYVLNAGSANRLWNNNADGTFKDIAPQGGIECAERNSVMLAPADVDGDRDTDLVIFHRDAPAQLFLNDRLGAYHEAPDWFPVPLVGVAGGVLQDFNGDGRPDLLVAPGPGTTGGLLLTGPAGAPAVSSSFEGVLEAADTWGPIQAVRVGDYDLDGDLDVALLGRGSHVLWNDGEARFRLQAQVWPAPEDDAAVLAREILDLTVDGVADLLRATDAQEASLELVPGVLTPPAHWLAVMPTGHRGIDGRTRSPASGFGTRIEMRCGLHSGVATFSGLDGGLCQSHRPVVFGLDGAARADYLAILWPDGVTQAEHELSAGMLHRIKESERKVASCPVLFAWNGKQFGFVTDFAGVGGLGYFVAPGEYAPPVVLEHVKLEPTQLQPRDGRYELRLTEPMEEVAYLDRLELVAVDHPPSVHVIPDERLVVGGRPASHRLLVVDERIFPSAAAGPNGQECAAALREVDRHFAYEPEPDRRFFGFCKPHVLELDFGEALGVLDRSARVHLFLNGSIEYPYSQTTYAAGQARVAWSPLRIERRRADGTWETVVADAGAPGGAARTIAVDLTGRLQPGDRFLRVHTNLEIYYDQIFLGVDRGSDGLAIHTVPLVAAELRRLGFPLEFTPDGHLPTIYDYGRIEATSAFKLPAGRYTRYGCVLALLNGFDDRYVVLGTGDEVAVSFDAGALPSVPADRQRSFILISHAYCKDMDLYTAEPDTVTPLPFQTMSRYPPPPGESPSDPAAHRLYVEMWNTRHVR